MKVIGRAERVDIPELGLKNLPAKIDTGAYSSSIDCSMSRVVPRDGKEALEYVVMRPGREGYSGEVVVTDDFETTEVRSSNGVEKRYVVFLGLSLNGETHRCRLTLANRAALRYPLLIGRTFLKEAGYLVDVSQGLGLPGDEEERML